jgi:hypothetical protein
MRLEGEPHEGSRAEIEIEDEVFGEITRPADTTVGQQTRLVVEP